MTCPIAAADPTRTAVVIGAATLTYGALHALVRGHEAVLKDQGLAGQRVAVRATNSPELIALHVAAARTRTTLLPQNLRLLPQEQDAQAARMGVKATLDLDAGVELPDAVDDGSASFHEDTELVLMTSGTSGLAKGARLPLRCFRASATACAEVLGTRPDDHWLLCLPLFHVGAIALMWRALFSGGAIHVVEPSDVAGIANRIVDGTISQASMVTATLTALVEVLRTTGRRASPALRAVLVGGGPVGDEVLVDARALGIPALWTWGMTEATSQIATARREDPAAACGRPLPGTTVRVLDDDDLEVAQGVIGELVVAGPTLFAGYVDDADATASARTRDGALRTRDLGFIDDEGRLHVVSRRTDLIVSGGENVYPAAVERALALCPAVVDIGVVPIPDARWGQRPAAVVVLKPGHSVDDVKAFAERSLAKLQRPDRYIVVDALPRNALGKLERAVMLQRAGSTTT